jgi:hypothetical protein
MAGPDLTQIICFLSPDSSATTIAFEVHEQNHAYRAPRIGGSGRPMARDPRLERGETPLFDTFDAADAEADGLEIFALTTHDRPITGTGIVFGSNPFDSHILLDNTNQNGVSSTHFKIYSSFQGQPEAATLEEIDSLMIENMSSNPVKVTSEHHDHPPLVKGGKIKISGGSWTIRISARVQISILLRFPDRGSTQAEFMANWRLLHLDQSQ